MLITRAEVDISFDRNSSTEYEATNQLTTVGEGKKRQVRTSTWLELGQCLNRVNDSALGGGTYLDLTRHPGTGTCTLTDTLTTLFSRCLLPPYLPG